ncbi:MAG: ribonuclease D [Myxococcales bacterium]|nr:ribonuclease D [Myxococcales bacterium]MCB9520946.1 ribonuclease D [Myxococcales bacterium]MCB9531690.1 ribonuclease D [Myxococcales bacterium]MCB9534423.1 ribonuclease D [Myxococcales bacterium]
MSATNELVLVDDAAGVAELARLVASADGERIALDIEEDREFRYRPSVALIQITVADRDFVIDPLGVPKRPLTEAIEAVCLMASAVVMHGCRNDIVGLKRDFGVCPVVACDTQLAARLLGHEAFGLAALLQGAFGIELDKTQRRSNWIQRPLTAEQIDYARQDTQHLMPLWDHLRARVEAAGWIDALDEECDAIIDFEEGPGSLDPDGWRGLKGMRALGRDEQARAAALWSWRDAFGRAHDRHPSRVLPPWAILHLARVGLRGLESDRAVPSGATAAELEALAACLESPPAPPPVPRKPRAGRTTIPPELFDRRMSRLCDWRTAASLETGLEPGFLAPRQLLEGLARVEATGTGALASVPEIRAWRLRRWGDEWAAILAG